jgi:hypothetical protein
MHTYWDAVAVLEAQEELAHMRVSDFPHHKKEQRRAIHRRLYRVAYPKAPAEGDVLTSADLASRLSEVLNG